MHTFCINCIYYSIKVNKGEVSMLRVGQEVIFTNGGSWVNDRLNGEHAIVRRIYDWEVTIDFISAESMGHRLTDIMVDVDELTPVKTK